jgi:hypothetical protein
MKLIALPLQTAVFLRMVVELMFLLRLEILLLLVEVLEAGSMKRAALAVDMEGLI